MKAFSTKYRTPLVVVLIVLIVGLGYWYIHGNQAPSFSAVAATRGNVVASLDEAGTVLSENSVDLSFQTPGEITAINVQEGDIVSQGMVLAALDTSALSAAAAQANAAVLGAQAKLDSLQSGTRPEQLAIDEQAVTTASSSLANVIQTAYASADDAIHNQTDNFFTNPNTSNPIFFVPDSDSQQVINIQSNRLVIGGSLTTWYKAMASSTDLLSLATLASNSLTPIASYLNTLALAVNAATPNSNVSASTLSGFKANVSAARAEVNGSIAALAAAQSGFESAEDELTLAQAGATPQDIEVQKAAVAQAQAAAQSAQVALQHAELIAPFGGTVENLTGKIGQVVSPGAPIVSIVNNSGLKIQTFVSQADVAKIQTGDSAQVTLDALGTGTIFPATITSIASAETQVNGVDAYAVTLHFQNPSSAIKDGMTGNVHVITGEHDNVIEVPSRLVLNQGNQYFVLVRQGNTTAQVPVQIGLIGNDTTEITSGVNVGDQIVNF